LILFLSQSCRPFLILTCPRFQSFLEIVELLRQLSSTTPRTPCRCSWILDRGRSEDISKGARRSIHYNLRECYRTHPCFSSGWRWDAGRPRHEAWKHPLSPVVVAPGLPRHFFDGRFFVKDPPPQRVDVDPLASARPRTSSGSYTLMPPSPDLCSPCSLFCNPRSTAYPRSHHADELQLCFFSTGHTAVPSLPPSIAPSSRTPASAISHSDAERAGCRVYVEVARMFSSRLLALHHRRIRGICCAARWGKGRSLT
jgi:hypothetical protein